MSLGGISNVGEAITQGLADVDAHAASIQAAESDILQSQSNVYTAITVRVSFIHFVSLNSRILLGSSSRSSAR